MEESKLYNQELESRLSKHSKVAILKAFMLKKQINWLRNVMLDTYEDGIKNWCLPLNHTIGTRHRSNHEEFANANKACRRLGGPFNAAKLNEVIGGNVRIYSNQEELYEFTRRLRDAQLLRREAILPTENGGY